MLRVRCENILCCFSTLVMTHLPLAARCSALVRAAVNHLGTVVPVVMLASFIFKTQTKVLTTQAGLKLQHSYINIRLHQSTREIEGGWILSANGRQSHEAGAGLLVRWTTAERAFRPPCSHRRKQVRRPQICGIILGMIEWKGASLFALNHWGPLWNPGHSTRASLEAKSTCRLEGLIHLNQDRKVLCKSAS